MSGVLFLILISIHSFLGKLTGDHICLKEVVKPTEVLQWELKNKTVRKYDWCWNVPPRCSTYFNVQTNETKTVTKFEAVTVETCCEGFYEENGECSKNCQGCRNGICENGNCICTSGHMGSNCDTECINGSIPLNCSEDCHCWKYLQCTASSESDCGCATGWLLDKCNINRCPNVDVGMNCVIQCTCDVRTHICGIVEGKCSIKERFVDKSVTELASQQNIQEFVKGFDSTPESVTNEAINLNNLLSQSESTSSSTFRNMWATEITVSAIQYSKHPTNFNLWNSGLDGDESEDHKVLVHKGWRTSNYSGRSYLIIITTLVGIAVLAITVSVGLIVWKCFKKYPKNNRHLDKNDTSVAVHTTSIFHTALPDPPLFDNPTYYIIKSDQSNATFNSETLSLKEFSVMEWKHSNNEGNECKGKNGYSTLQPSTVAKHPVEKYAMFEFKSSLGSFSQNVEPLYDEIPCRDTPVPCNVNIPNDSSLYMNTEMTTAQ